LSVAVTEVEFDRTFSADLLTTGFGAGWCADYRIPCLFRIDASTLLPDLFVDLPPHNDKYGRLLGPASLVAGPDALWVLERSGSVLRVDPERPILKSIATPFPFAAITVGHQGLLGIEEFEDGRIARISAQGEAAIGAVGRSLQLLAVDGDRDLVWTVDDAEGVVLAIDVETLEVVQRFPHVGGPTSLWARHGQAWYLASREVVHDGERATVLTPQGTLCDLLHLDAASGTIEQLATLVTTVPATARDPDGFWISGSIEDDFEDDPINRLLLVSESGEMQREFQLLGQVDSVCRDTDSVWVSGFRRSAQRQVVSRFRPTGVLLGEIDMSGIDVGRWIPEPPPIEWPPLNEWAASVRKSVERGLTSSAWSIHRDGSRHAVPAISEEFQFKRTELRVDDESALLDVIFAWEGEDGLFGRTFQLVQDDFIADSPDAYVTVYLEEDLLATGFGIENARRDPRDGVTWLSWRQGDEL
jgi:hypothetical protein